MENMVLRKKAVLVVLGLFCILFSISLASNFSPIEGKTTKENVNDSNLSVLLFFATPTDFSLGEALAQEANISLEAYNISDSGFKEYLPLSLKDFQAIWWFTSTIPSVSPIDLFNDSYNNMASWFASKKGFLIITEHISNLDLTIREFVGIKGVYPYSYPLNGSETSLELEVIADRSPLNKTLFNVPKGTKMTLSSRAGFFIPDREKDVVAQVAIGNEFADMTSGLVVPHDLRFFSALLSLSPSQTWLSPETSRVAHELSLASSTSQVQSLEILDILQMIATFSTSGDIPVSPDGEAFVGLSGDLLYPISIGLLGLLTISFLFVGFKTGRIQKLVFGFFSGTVLFIAHVAYSPSNRRLDRGDLLANKLRARIVDTLHAKGPGGAHLRELQRELNCGISSLLWHLQTLDDFGVVDHAKLGGYHVFYLTELVGIEGISPELVMTIRSATAKEICRALVKKPKKPQKLTDLAKSAECHLETARYHLKKLEGAGVVTRIRDKSRTYYTLRQDLVPEIHGLVSN